MTSETKIVVGEVKAEREGAAVRPWRDALRNGWWAK